MNDDNRRFVYQYKALTKEEKRQIQSIQNEYASLEGQNDLERLKLLHRKVKYYPRLFCIIIVIFECLIFGLGMSMVLVWEKFFLGICIGCVGLFSMLFTKWIYMKIYHHQKKKYAQMILDLSSHLLESDE